MRKRNFKVTMGIMALIFAWIILSMPMVNADPLRPSFANKTEQTGPTAGSQVIYGKTSGGAVTSVLVDSSGGITETNSTDIKASVEIMDDWDDSDYCNVNLNVSGTDVSANAGVNNDQTQRVTIATDDEMNDDLEAVKTAVETIDNAISGSEMQVDIVADGAGLATSLKQDDIIADTGAIQTAVETIDDWEGSGNYADHVKGACYIDNGSGTPVIMAGDAAGNPQIDIVSSASPIVTIVTKTASQDLSAAALSYTTDFAAQTRIKGVYLKASGAISETISVTIDMAEGASYDTVVSADTLASETSFAYTPDELILSSGDELIITCTDTGGAETVYVTVKGETLN